MLILKPFIAMWIDFPNVPGKIIPTNYFSNIFGYGGENSRNRFVFSNPKLKISGFPYLKYMKNFLLRCNRLTSHFVLIPTQSLRRTA